MQKSKALTIVLSIIIVLALIVVMASSLFCINTVSLVWYNTPSKCSHLTEQHLVSISGMKDKQSVFTMNREKYISNIEKSEEYLKVLSLEVVWPNNLKIHIMEREEIYYIPMLDNTYLVTDSEFKVLRKVFSGNNNTIDNCIKITGRQGFDANSYDVGDFLPQEYFVDYLPLVDAFGANDQDLVSMQALIQSISIIDNTMSMQTYSGVTIDLLNAQYYTTTKLRTALSILSSLSASQLSTGSIYVFKNDYSIIEGRYIA